MTTSSSRAGVADLLDDRSTAPAHPLARAILAQALLVGIAADLLLREGPTGIGFAIWMALAAAVAVALVWRDGRPVSVEMRAWLAAAVLCAAGMGWRDAGMLQFADFWAAAGALIMAAIAASDETRALFASRLRDTLLAGTRVLRSLAAGPVSLLRPALAGTSAMHDWQGRLASVARPVVIVAVFVFVFGGLLAGADPVFATFVQLPRVNFDTVASHALVIALFAWLAAGWARAALLAGPAPRPADRLPFALSRADVTAALGTLTVLFVLYVLAQAGWLFGGERFLRERVGLTAAEYARHGFFEMVWVVLLALPVLLVTRAALPPGRDAARRHTALALPIVALLAVMIASAAVRMRLYVQYFGLTTDRIYPMVFMAWLAWVLVWLAATVLRDRGRPFAAGAIVSGALVLAALHAVVPDVVVARVNTTRASSGSLATPLDVGHLTSLGGDAVPTTVAWVVATPGSGATPDTLGRERCQGAQRLLERWGPSSREAQRMDEPGAWRRWNAGRHAALGAVAANSAALRTIARGCPGRPRMSTGSSRTAAAPRSPCS